MKRLALALALATLLAACSTSSGSPTPPAGATPPTGSGFPPAAAGGSAQPTPRASPTAAPSTSAAPSPTEPPIGPRPEFSAGDVVVTVSDDLIVRSKPRVADDSTIYRPALDVGTYLEVRAGPVAASGYWWYRVRLWGVELPGGIRAGWVAAADHDGEPWIAWPEDAGEEGPLVVCPDWPTPRLVIERAYLDVGGDGQPYTYFDLDVRNWDKFPAELFEPAPDLPPCGLNRRSSRTWVDILGEDDRTGDEWRIYGFCALGEPEGLTHTWFAVPQGDAPPPFVFIRLEDRRTGCTIDSNRVVPPWPMPTPEITPSPSPPG